MIQFIYRNYKGETELRRVEPKHLDFLRKPGFDYQPGWFLIGLDLDRNEMRSFALSHIVLDDTVHTPYRLTLDGKK